MYQPYGYNYGNYYNAYSYHPTTQNYFGYYRHGRILGKREAEAEPEADPQVFYHLQNQKYQPYGFNYGNFGNFRSNYGYNFRNNYYNTYQFPGNYRTYGYN